MKRKPFLGILVIILCAASVPLMFRMNESTMQSHEPYAMEETERKAFDETPLPLTPTPEVTPSPAPTLSSTPVLRTEVPLKPMNLTRLTKELWIDNEKLGELMIGLPEEFSVIEEDDSVFDAVATDGNTDRDVFVLCCEAPVQKGLVASVMPACAQTERPEPRRVTCLTECSLYCFPSAAPIAAIAAIMTATTSLSSSAAGGAECTAFGGCFAAAGLAAGAGFAGAVFAGSEGFFFPADLKIPPERYRKMTRIYVGGNIAVIGGALGGLFCFQIVNQNNRHPDPVEMPGLLIAHSPGGIPASEEDWEIMRYYSEKDPVTSLAYVRQMKALTAFFGEPVPDHALSPVFMDFHNAPESYVFYGEETCAGNASAYVKSYNRDHSSEKMHMHIEPGAMHCYAMKPFFPESKRDYDRQIKLLNLFIAKE